MAQARRMKAPKDQGHGDYVEETVNDEWGYGVAMMQHSVTKLGQSYFKKA
jgi:hypothetical protein